MKSRNCNMWLLGLALSLVLVGCSSKNAKPETQEVEASLTKGDDSLPNADEVGSIPEDNPDALNELAKTNPSGAGGDPFADLEDNLAKDKGEKEEKMPAATSGGSGEMRTYKVRRGDTLMKIAFKLYGDIDRWKDLKNWNSGTVHKASALEPGTALSYQDEGEFVVEKLDHNYKIKQGDTLGGIAKTVYGKTNKWRKLQKYNARLIKNPNRIFAGFTLYYNITPEEEQQAGQAPNSIGSAAPAANPNVAPAAVEAPAPAPAPVAQAPAVPADVQAKPAPVAQAPSNGAVSQ